uniref:Niban-like protein 1 n=1 Tax=Sinocyclocheilus anshuiensis TaxID=1608454 RepID=A0A671P2G5_9TELE
MGEFGRLYEQQYAVALFNKMRYDIEGGGGPQNQLLHRKMPLKNKSIFSGALFQYLEENKKWRNRFLFIPDSYNINYYENKQAHDRGLHPKGTINCAGYRVLTSMEEYLELLNTSLPGVKAKVGSSPFLKCATQFPLILWHPYARHYYFCMVTEKEQQKWNALFQDCVRHTNNGLPEECKVQTPAFTDAVRLYRQTHGHYGTWDMMCGMPPQILANLVMETLLPEMRDLITPKLKGKMHERQRNWMLISDAVYGLVQSQTQAQYEAVVQSCEAGRPALETTIRTDMDQIITSKEHVCSKIRALVLPKAEKLLKVSIQPYISSILDALMEPTSRGFFEVRDLFFRELVDMSKNLLNDGNKEKLGEHMEKISMLAFHPVKMQSCYEKVETLSLEGLQQRFDVSSPSVFVQRAQILMREQMDDAVYTFEQLLHQSLEGQEREDLCKTTQRCQDRVIKKFDYDSSTVRKKFFREALLQIFIPYMLKQLSPSCSAELPRFQELIFEDFSRFILVENIFEEVVLHTVMKDIMMAVKEAAVQRRHNLYRDSIVLTNSDPNLHLLGENPPIDWAEEYGGGQEEVDGENAGDPEAQKRRRMKQVVSMIQIEGNASVLPNESCLEVPTVDNIPEEEAEVRSEKQVPNGTKKDVNKNAIDEIPPTNGSAIKEEESTTEKSLQDTESKSAIDCAIQEIENAVQEEEHELRTQKTAESSSLKEETAAEEVKPTSNCEEEARINPENHITASTHDSSQHDDSGFQSPTNEAAEEEHQAGKEECNDSETGEDIGKGESAHMDHQ